jgi:DNA-binding LytR/AlgR family response regulator
MIYSRKLTFKIYDQLTTLAPEDIICCRADEGWSGICLVGNREMQINKPISFLMKKLPTKHFIRVHRDWIANVHFIENVIWSQHKIIMEEGLILPLFPIMKFRLENLLLDNPIFCRELEWME